MKSYTFKKFKKQLLPYLLSFAIVLGAFSWKAPEADAIATEAVVAAIISVAIGSGLAFAVDRMTSPEVDAYWTGQAQQWLQSVGQSYSDFVDQAEQNMSSKDGKLILGGSFYQSIQNFLSWFRSSNDVESGADTPSVIYSNNRLTLGQLSFPILVSSTKLPSYNEAFAIPVSNLNVTITNEVASNLSDGFYRELGGRVYAVAGGVRSSDYVAYRSQNVITHICPLYFTEDGKYYFSYFYKDAHNPGFGEELTFPNVFSIGGSSLSVSQPSEVVVLEPTEALPSVALDVGASSEDDLETVIRSVLDGYLDNTLVVDQELTGAGEGEGTDTDGLFGILHGISGTLSDVLDAVLSIPAAIAATVTGFIGSIGNFLSGAYFGFSGIWHYVVTWVGSMAAGAAVIWSVWNGLPSAMIIPVYATAVIVIVVGLWRRFFE